MPTLPSKTQIALTFGGNDADVPHAQGKTSIELLEFVNDARTEAGEATIRHNVFLSRCKDELDGEPYKTFVESAKGHAPAFEAIFMTVDQCKLVAMRESKGVRRRVLARLNALEAQAAQPVQPQVAMPDLTTDEGKLLMIQDLATKQLALLADNKRIQLERNEAIRTKAQISDRKTATAMATASAKAREVKRLEHALGYSTRHATILQVEKKLKREFDYHPLRRWCNQQKVTPERVPDKRYGDVVAWPADAWMAVYSVSLPEIFGE